MPKINLRRAKRDVTAGRIERTGKRLADPAKMDPDTLRDRVYEELSKLSPDERAIMTNRLLAGLADAELRPRPTLFLLGIVVVTLDDLTPFEVGKIMRFVRLNSPELLEFVSAPLVELLARSGEQKRRVSLSRRAA